MTRLPDWQARLTAYVDASRRVAPTHCGYFAGRAVEAMTGVAILPETITGQKRADLVAMGHLGHRDVLSFLRALLPEADGPAQPGDVVVIKDNDTEPTLGILQGRLVYVMSASGLVMMPSDKITGAFRV